MSNLGLAISRVLSSLVLGSAARREIYLAKKGLGGHNYLLAHSNSPFGPEFPCPGLANIQSLPRPCADVARMHFERPLSAEGEVGAAFQRQFQLSGNDSL